MTKRLFAACLAATLAAAAAMPAAAAEKLLKLRPYTFACGAGQDCVGWRHSFAFIDPSVRLPEPPRDSYIEVYSAPEVDQRLEKLAADLVQTVNDAFARAGAAGAPADADQLRRLRDDVAADVVAQLARIMAEREAQTREWLQHQIREELRAAGAAR